MQCQNCIFLCLWGLAIFIRRGAPGVSLHTFALNLFILHIEIEHALMYNTDDSNTNPRR